MKKTNGQHARVKKTGKISAADEYCHRHVREILEEVGAHVTKVAQRLVLHRDYWLLDQSLRDFLFEKIDLVWQEGFEDGWNDYAENPPEK